MSRLAKQEIIGFFFTVVIGVFMHFLYDWTGQNKIVSIFSSINESTWEHLKLLFFPSFLYAIIAYFYGGKLYNGYFTIKALAILSGMLTIVALFYTYTGIIGNHYMWVDILTFIIGSAVVSLISYKMLPSKEYDNSIGIAVLLVVTAVFFIFTFNPPMINLFAEP